MINPLKIIKNGILTENPTFVLVLGMCPTIAVTTSAINGLGMGLAATAVLMGSNMAISAIRKCFVTVVQLLISAYAPALNKSLGIFIPLIVVNCIILARAEAYAYKNGVIASMFDGVGMGLGFTAALILIGSIREALGNGTVFGVTVLPPEIYAPALLVILAPGGFITLGILMAFIRHLKMRKEEKATGVQSSYDGWQELDACGGCALKGICHGTTAGSVCAKNEKEAGK